jgi:hypothetical protein
MAERHAHGTPLSGKIGQHYAANGSSIIPDERDIRMSFSKFDDIVETKISAMTLGKIFGILIFSSLAATGGRSWQWVNFRSVSSCLIGTSGNSNFVTTFATGQVCLTSRSACRGKCHQYIVRKLLSPCSIRVSGTRIPTS